jgi:hypothetical protein
MRWCAASILLRTYSLHYERQKGWPLKATGTCNKKQGCEKAAQNSVRKNIYFGG